MLRLKRGEGRGGYSVLVVYRVARSTLLNVTGVPGFSDVFSVHNELLSSFSSHTASLHERDVRRALAREGRASV